MTGGADFQGRPRGRGAEMVLEVTGVISCKRGRPRTVVSLMLGLTGTVREGDSSTAESASESLDIARDARRPGPADSEPSDGRSWMDGASLRCRPRILGSWLAIATAGAMAGSRKICWSVRGFGLAIGLMDSSCDEDSDTAASASDTVCFSR